MHRAQKPIPQLTRLELEIMQVLWSRGRGNVRLVQENPGKSRAYNTVQTVLNILERKGQVERSLKGRAYEYIPTLTSEKSLGSALKDVIDRMFGGSAEKLIIALVQNGLLTAERLGAWRKDEPALRRLKSERAYFRARIWRSSFAS
jgi:BlaI family transcriptional regulator, penicillinase repressor